MSHDKRHQHCDWTPFGSPCSNWLESYGFCLH